MTDPCLNTFWAVELTNLFSGFAGPYHRNRLPGAIKYLYLMVELIRNIQPIAFVYR